ncbi:MAG: hypothetical protein HY270_15255 [Deltaproteobacteria bacterium]|nr:hypothetical protein [Deltaproteobacteria bacterium]
MSRNRTAFLRTTLAIVVVADLLSFYFFIGAARANALADGLALTWLTDFLSHPAVRGTIVLFGIAGAATFAARPGRLWHGLLALAALSFLSSTHAQLFGSPWRHLFYSGLCLSGWLAGLAFGRWRGQPEDEAYARTGSIALLGTAYFNAGLSKLVYGGFGWASGRMIQAIIVGQDGLVADGVLSIYRSWVVGIPAIAAMFSIATLAFELAGPLMILDRWVRPCVALGLLAMHGNIYLLSDILYWESMVFLIVFGLLPEPSPQQSSADTGDAGRHGQWFTPLSLALAVCAVAGVYHQGQRYVLRQMPVPPNGPVVPVPDAAAPVINSSPPAVTPAQQRLSQIGPFVVGQTVTDGWTIQTIDLSREGFAIELGGIPGRVRFGFTCTTIGSPSPFDVGAAHIFYYKSDLDPEKIEAPGRALQKRVQAVAAGHDLCASIDAWRAAAPSTTPQ